MKSLIAWFAQNTVAANLLMFVILVAGLVTIPYIKQEVFPEFSTDLIVVSVPYPGAAPEEIEESINARIEERIGGLEGVKRITSTAAEGMGAITVEALPGVDVRALLNDVKSEVDAIDTLPVESEEPTIRELVPRHHVISVAIQGNADERTLKRLGDRIRDELSARPDITQVELINARPYEISIEVSEETLRRHGLTFDEVARAVRSSSFDLPGGSIKSEGGEILLRTKGQAYTGNEFAGLVLMTRPDGTRLYLSDIAEVVDGFADTDQSAEFDGEPAVLVKVFRVGEQSALKIADSVKSYIEDARTRVPDGITLTAWDDNTEVLRGRLATLRRNGLQGLLLVFLTLALFLQLRIALWTTAGIPLAFLGTLWLMPHLGVSINVLSLFSFILVLGIVVDDATVIGENVFKHRERGVAGLQAAVEGTQEVAIPVIFGVLTTVAVFLPMFGLPGVMGKIMSVFPSVVIPTLLFSLIESQLILPAHLRHAVVDWKGEEHGLAAIWKRVQTAVGNGLGRFIERVYRPGLEIALEWRYSVASAALAFLVITGATFAAGWIKMSFFPEVEADNVVAELTMPRGTSREKTAEVLDRLVAAVDELRTEFGPRAGSAGVAIKHVLASLGDQPVRSAQSRTGSQANSGAHIGEVNLQLAPAEEREFASAEVASRWREIVGPIADVTELTFTSSLFQAGDPIDIELSATDLGQLRSAADRLKAALGGYAGVFDVADSFRPGKQEIKLAIKPEAEALGLTLQDLARQVRQAFYGEEAQRVQRGREDIKVMVRYPAAERRSLVDIERMRIRTLDGDEVPFSTVADLDLGRGYATIDRVDRRRVVAVTADVDPKSANANEVLAALNETILPQLRSDYPGLRVSLEGEQREQRETFEALQRGFLVALLVIYALIAVPLGSYIQPLIVMSAIPFGISGAIWAHQMLGMDLSFLSVFGIVALTGVVVNDCLVLVDYVNRSRGTDDPVAIAVRNAGEQRFRPILLTSLTTFAGLTPLLLERSLQAQFLIPMAVSLGFGVLFATGVSLVLVPCNYLILEDVRALLRRRRARRSEQEEAPEPTRPAAVAARDSRRIASAASKRRGSAGL